MLVIRIDDSLPLKKNKEKTRQGIVALAVKPRNRGEVLSKIQLFSALKEEAQQFNDTVEILESSESVEEDKFADPMPVSLVTAMKEGFADSTPLPKPNQYI